MTQNSALSQNWVGCIGCTPNGPWLRAHCAQAARALRPGRDRTVARPRAGRNVVAHRAPCGRPCPTVSGRVAARTRALARHVSALLPSPLVMIQKLYSDTSPCHASCRAPTAPYRGACSVVSQCCCAPCHRMSRDTPSSQAALVSRYAHSYRDTTPTTRPPSCHETNDWIVTHPTS